MPKKRNVRSARIELLRSNIDFVASLSRRLQAVLFVLAFGVIGGAGWLAYDSFAGTKPAEVSMKTCESRYPTRLALHRGAKNNGCVRTVQDLAVHLEGWYPSMVSKCPSAYRPKAYSLDDDGDFGPITEKYVKCYQYWRGYRGSQVDGYIGNMTWGILRYDCDKEQYYGVKC